MAVGFVPSVYVLCSFLCFFFSCSRRNTITILVRGLEGEEVAVEEEEEKEEEEEEEEEEEAEEAEGGGG